MTVPNVVLFGGFRRCKYLFSWDRFIAVHTVNQEFATGLVVLLPQEEREEFRCKEGYCTESSNNYRQGVLLTSSWNCLMDSVWQKLQVTILQPQSSARWSFSAFKGTGCEH